VRLHTGHVYTSLLFLHTVIRLHVLYDPSLFLNPHTLCVEYFVYSALAVFMAAYVIGQAIIFFAMWFVSSSSSFFLA